MSKAWLFTNAISTKISYAGSYVVCIPTNDLNEMVHIGLDKQNFLNIFLVLTYVLSAQKNRLIETVLLSTHNICFG